MAGPDARVPQGYPSQWEADVVLADGGLVHVRPIRPDDAPRVVAFHGRQSAESIYFRFFSPRPRLSERDVEYMTHVDYSDRMAFVATLGEELVGEARYDRWKGTSHAEVAFFVDDSHNGRGVATVLLEYLAARAREVGIDAFTAQVLPANRKMLGVMRRAGFAVRSRFADGAIEVDMAIDPTATALAAIEERAMRADARSVQRLLAPSSIAVVGAGRDPGTVGHEVLRCLLGHHYAGELYAVNPYADNVAGVPVHARVLDIDGPVDVAIVAVPTDVVPAVVDDCAAKGVAGLVVLTAGFGETGRAGLEAEQRLVTTARRHAMRVIGPNAMGFVNTAPAVHAKALFSPVPVRAGRVALASQSGTIAAVILNEIHAGGLGVSTFVSLGNGADVRGNDLLSYWEGDDDTDLVLLYLESFGTPRTFSRVARRVSATKPIVAVRTGTTPALDVLLGQTGVVRVETLEELVDVARVFGSQPLPEGRRVAVVSNAGSPALAIEACIGAGLDLASLTAATKEHLRTFLPPGAGIANPLELTHRAGPSDYERAVAALLADEGVDAVLVLYAPPVSPRTAAVAAALGQVVASAATSEKPVVASFVADVPLEGLGTVPNFRFPDAAARALGRVAEYAAWRRMPEGALPVFDGMDLPAARDLVAAAIAEGPASGLLDPAATLVLVASAGVSIVEQHLASTEEETVVAADALGYPVALKATGLERLAKTEAGGVAVDVHGAREVRAAYRRMADLLGPAMVPAVVQHMVDPGTDVRVGVRFDPTVGAVMSIGTGGAAAVVSDTDPHGVRILPLTDRDAGRLVASSPIALLLDDDDRVALEDLLLRVSALVDDVPEIVALELNPIIVGGGTAWVTDMRARVSPFPEDPLTTVRRLGG